MLTSVPESASTLTINPDKPVYKLCICHDQSHLKIDIPSVNATDVEFKDYGLNNPVYAEAGEMIIVFIELLVNPVEGTYFCWHKDSDIPQLEPLGVIYSSALLVEFGASLGYVGSVWIGCEPSFIAEEEEAAVDQMVDRWLQG